MGQLNYLRIWHDNSGFGSDASWFLKYVIVRNLQTMETTYFICQKWLAVEKDSGEVSVLEMRDESMTKFFVDRSNIDYCK